MFSASFEWEIMLWVEWANVLYMLLSANLGDENSINGFTQENIPEIKDWINTKILVDIKGQWLVIC